MTSLTENGGKSKKGRVRPAMQRWVEWSEIRAYLQQVLNVWHGFEQVPTNIHLLPLHLLHTTSGQPCRDPTPLRRRLSSCLFISIRRHSAPTCVSYIPGMLLSLDGTIADMNSLRPIHLASAAMHARLAWRYPSDAGTMGG